MWPVNYNCPGQLVVAGEKEELGAFRQRVAEAGGKAVPLAVSGGFHSPFMASAAEKLEKKLESVSFGTPRIPVFANFNAQPYGENAGELIVRQVKSPVRWQETVEALAAQGADTFLECGAGKTLCGLIKKTVKGARVFQVENAETLQAAVEALL